VKTNKVALAAGVFAGIAALPLTTASAATASAPNGSANAAALNVTVSLAPVLNLVGTANMQTLTTTLDALQNAICGNSVTTAICPINLDVLKDLPSTLQVAVAQANDNATLNALATDVTAGHADSSPLYTNWKSLNADLSNLGTAVTTLVNQVTTALSNGAAPLAQALITGGLGAVVNGLPNLNGVLAVDTSQITGTVKADLPSTPWSSAQAVSVGSSAVPNVSVNVDPFTACAANAALFSKCGDGATGAETAASNELVGATLPALNITGVNAANLPSIAKTLKSLLDAVTNAIANPSQASGILSAAPVPSQLAGPLGTIGGLLDTAGATTSATTASSPISLDLLKQWDQQLSGMLDSLTALDAAIANLDLPTTASLLSSKVDIATAKTVPTVGGGVLSTSTANLGNVSVLPVGGTLSGTLNTALKLVPSVGGITLNLLDATTPVLGVDGITSTSQAGVGSAPACGKNADGSSEFVCGSSGLKTVSVLGQVIDLDHGTINGLSVPALQGGLPAGAEWHHTFTIQGVGSVTLDIVRGLPQIVSDTPQYREVRTAALDVRLVNGAEGCSTSTCTDPIPATGTNSAATANTAGTNSGATGIAALGADGPLAALEVASTDAAAGFIAPTCTSGCGGPNVLTDTKHQTSLPETGMFGGNVLPLGLGLIAVAISLRLVPSLRLRLRRVR